MIKMKSMLVTAGTIAAFGIAAPAAAATPNVQLAMASYASTIAGTDADVRVAAKERHYQEHHVRGQDAHASATCEECAACIECEECTICETACEDGVCQTEVESGTATA